MLEFKGTRSNSELDRNGKSKSPMRGKGENLDLPESTRQQIKIPKNAKHLQPFDMNLLVKDGNTLAATWVSNRVRLEEETNLKIKSKQMFEAAKQTQIALGKVPNLDMEVNQQQQKALLRVYEKE